MNKETILLLIGVLIGLVTGFSVGKFVYESSYNKIDPSAKTSESISNVDRGTALDLIKDREDIEDEKPFDFSFLGN